MEQRTSSLLSSLLGLIIAAIFLFFTFRGMDLGAVAAQLAAVNPWSLLAMCVICLLSLLARGVRWYYLLPEPRRAGELGAVQRSLALCYGVNNLASRVGEVVRLVVLRRDTGRSVATIAASVVADRLVFDSVSFAALVAFALYAFSDQLLAVFPQLAQVIPLFMLVTASGIVGMVAMALKPHWFEGLLIRLGLSKIDVLWSRIEPLIHQLSEGLRPITRPREMSLAMLANLATWLLSYAHFAVCLAAFGIELGPVQILFIFTVTSFGFVLPSPGGMGTFHYFMIAGLTRFMTVDESLAAAVATTCHGINYLVLTFAAIFALFFKPKCSGVVK